MLEAAAINKSKRIVELDALRALAALNLLLFHFTYLYQCKYGFSTPLGIDYPYGKYGVQLFFMLSGLVNAMTLLSKHHPEDFLAARLIRICPPFWAALLVNLVLVCMLPLAAHPPTVGQWFANATIVPGLFGQACIEPVTWTLQVELLFYVILLGLYCIGGFRTPVRMIWLVLLVVVAVCLPLKHALVVQGSGTFAMFSALKMAFILETLPLFLVGILLNELRCGRGSWKGHLATIVACGFVFHCVDERGFNPMVTVAFTVLLGLSAFGRLPVLRLRPIVFISGISYSLYLLHNNLGSTLIFHLDPQVGPWGAIVIATAVVFTIAIVSTYCFERPLAAWLNRRWKEFRLARIASRVVPSARLSQTSSS